MSDISSKPNGPSSRPSSSASSASSEAKPETHESDNSPVKNQRELLLAVMGICAVVMLVGFDATIVGTMLPRVVAELGGMELYAWVGTGYLLASVIVLPIFGRLGDLFGRKTYILVSIGLVGFGSILCGISQSMIHLILARSLQGIGGGMLIATAFAAPADLFPDAMRRVKWQAFFSSSFAVASGLGPLIGGTITEQFGWRAAFFVTPTMSVVAFALLWFYFPRLVPKHASRPRVDWLGGALLAFAVGGPMAALGVGFAKTGAQPGLAIIFALIGAVAIAILIPYERRVESPMLPLRVLALRESRLLNLLGVLTGAVMFTLVYYGPLLLQVVVGMTPTQAGGILAPLVACIPAGSMINGRLFPRQTQPQRLMMAGITVLAVGCLGVMTLGQGSSMAFAVVAFAICGLGLGFIVPNLTLFMQMIADRRDVGVASALIQTTRTLGSAIGTAAVGIIISRTSVLAGVQIGLAISVAFCGVMLYLASQIKMKNIQV